MATTAQNLLQDKAIHRLLVTLVARDLRVLVKAPWIIVSRGLAFVVQIFVFAVLMSRLVDVPGFDFFTYYALGTVLVTVASVAFLTGYDVYEENETGMLDYLLSLPLSRRGYVMARSVGGALRSLVYVTPLFAIVAFLRGFFNPIDIAVSYVMIFLLATGITGLSISVALSVRNQDRFDVSLALLELFFIRFSTALYPQAFMPLAAGMIAPFSPVTMTSDAVRAILGHGTIDLLGVAGLLAFVISMLALGAAIYLRKIEGGYFD
ncbi:MAG: ABC transporter permease [Thaumarchaeota archaeon]|nr:ABC transporter permease [Nitrososphaerota archaeon]